MSLSPIFEGGGVSIGMLRGVVSFPTPEMPEWANVTAKRLYSMGVPHGRVVEIIEEMERTRRATARRLLRRTEEIPNYCKKLAEAINCESPPKARGT